MLTSQAFFQHELIKLITAEIDRIKENLTIAGGTPDFPTYRHQVGVVDGLRLSLELMGVAESAVNGVERG